MEFHFSVELGVGSTRVDEEAQLIILDSELSKSTLKQNYFSQTAIVFIILVLKKYQTNQ